MVKVKLLSDPTYAYYEGRVHGKMREEVGDKTELDVLFDWLESFNAVGDGFGFIASNESVPFLYLLRDKRSLKGGLFSKALGWKAWNLENISGLHILPRYCMNCGLSSGDVNYSDIAGFDPWYLLKPETIRGVDGTFTLHLPPTNLRVLTGDVAVGNHAMQRGLLVCSGCIDVVKNVDVGRTSLLLGLIDRADAVRMREIEQLALNELPYYERYRIKAREANAKAQKRRLVRNAENNVAVEFELGPDGKLRQKGDDL